MKALILGAGGQLGRALVATAPATVQAIGFTSGQLDITDAAAVACAVDLAQPTVILNAAAYTAVDRAEQDQFVAHAVNALAVEHLAAAARKADASLLHVSTDFVFDGTSGTPYTPDASTNPLSVYGHTKLAGELAAGPDALVVRTAWVYAAQPGNFVHTMLRLMADRDEVRVVADQIGTPTWATSLAEALWRLAPMQITGVLHYTDSGAASWYDFAVAIHEEALALGILQRPVRIVPITTANYPTPARRPTYSILDKTATFQALGGPAPHWRENLRLMLKEYSKNG